MNKFRMILWFTELRNYPSHLFITVLVLAGWVNRMEGAQRCWRFTAPCIQPGVDGVGLVSMRKIQSLHLFISLDWELDQFCWTIVFHIMLFFTVISRLHSHCNPKFKVNFMLQLHAGTPGRFGDFKTELWCFSVFCNTPELPDCAAEVSWALWKMRWHHQSTEPLSPHCAHRLRGKRGTRAVGPGLTGKNGGVCSLWWCQWAQPQVAEQGMVPGEELS